MLSTKDFKRLMFALPLFLPKSKRSESQCHLSSQKDQRTLLGHLKYFQLGSTCGSPKLAWEWDFFHFLSMHNKFCKQKSMIWWSLAQGLLRPQGSEGNPRCIFVTTEAYVINLIIDILAYGAIHVMKQWSVMYSGQGTHEWTDGQMLRQY